MRTSIGLAMIGMALVAGNSLSQMVTTDPHFSTGQGPYISWNYLNGGAGETDFVKNGGGGGGGFAFYNTHGSDTPLLFMMLNSAGNLGIGIQPSARLEVNGNVRLTAGSGASITFPDATVQATAWNGVLTGGDYAESVDVTGDRGEYQPGDVMVIDPTAEGHFLKSSAPYATTVTGIYSTKPGVVGRCQLTDREQMKTEDLQVFRNAGHCKARS